MLSEPIIATANKDTEGIAIEVQKLNFFRDDNPVPDAKEFHAAKRG